MFFYKNGPTPASFSFIFGLFEQTIQFLQQINVKNVHPVHGTEMAHVCFSKLPSHCDIQITI